MPKSSREIIKLLKKDGWYLERVTGDHHHFRHPTKKGTVTVPHPKKDLPKGTIRSIERQSGVKLL
ncbi:type II toxin-antitoxin system HicA family toxin [Polycladomyces sp. WAk]|uniref:Type II toxin-antitoxin system HicA family toxin n=1 Tax=Polycladomyces zharkentensis TaxID=2807616 RepID=A0ABS2WGA7_9BACL|nr:type II toxin-antitoxin system HicA family toxin [Polycladomyces sp. WAk]